MSQAGRLRHRLTLIRRVEKEDGRSGFTETDQRVAGFWGRVRTVTSKERFYSRGLRAEASHFVRIRFRQDVDEESVLLFRGVRLQVLGTQNVDERDRWLDLDCKKET